MTQDTEKLAEQVREAAAKEQGPWSFDGPPDNLIVWSDAGHRVCFMTSDGNAEANARLIAAAPVLLKAAEQMIDAHETDSLGEVTAAIGDLIYARGLARGTI